MLLSLQSGVTDNRLLCSRELHVSRREGRDTVGGPDIAGSKAVGTLQFDTGAHAVWTAPFSEKRDMRAEQSFCSLHLCKMLHTGMWWCASADLY